ncbi:hypothetical protein N9219_00405 [bacterium]|nr:hypothetical protein [bacterium]
MGKIQKKIIEENCSENDSTVGAEEKALIVLPVKMKRNEDETISSQGSYVSRYHYTTRNIDKYLEFCPHCKKPTMSAFHRTVIDNAIDYLEGRRVLKHYPRNQSKFLKYSTGLVAAGAAVVFLLLPLIFKGNL